MKSSQDRRPSLETDDRIVKRIRNNPSQDPDLVMPLPMPINLYNSPLLQLWGNSFFNTYPDFLLPPAKNSPTSLILDTSVEEKKIETQQRVDETVVKKINQPHNGKSKPYYRKKFFDNVKALYDFRNENPEKKLLPHDAKYVMGHALVVSKNEYKHKIRAELVISAQEIILGEYLSAGACRKRMTRGTKILNYSLEPLEKKNQKKNRSTKIILADFRLSDCKKETMPTKGIELIAGKVKFKSGKLNSTTLVINKKDRAILGERITVRTFNNRQLSGAQATSYLLQEEINLEKHQAPTTVYTEPSVSQLTFFGNKTTSTHSLSENLLPEKPSNELGHPYIIKRLAPGGAIA